MVLFVKKNALLSALEGAKNLYPNEFIALFRGEEKGKQVVLTELIIPPFSHYEESSSSFSDYFLPANVSAEASFHSHPSANSSFPSAQDKRFFERMRFHFIASCPFRMEDVNAFDSKARRVDYQII